MSKFDYSEFEVEYLPFKYEAWYLTSKQSQSSFKVRSEVKIRRYEYIRLSKRLSWPI
jgi:hypothetical protein